MGFPVYEPARRCTGTTPAGSKAFMKWALEWQTIAYNLGILVCRSVRGSSSTSTHAEGRGIDVGFPTVNGRANPAGWLFVRALLPHVGKLGIQQIIWDRMIWSRKHPNGTRYTGVHPHRDHVHVELTWFAALHLTVATIRAAMAGVKPTPSTIHPEADMPLTQADIDKVAAATASRVWGHQLQDLRPGVAMNAPAKLVMGEIFMNGRKAVAAAQAAEKFASGAYILATYVRNVADALAAKLEVRLQGDGSGDGN